MTRFLLLLSLVGLVAELASIIAAGNLLGLVPTLLLLFLSGAFGVLLIRSAGLSIAAAFRSPVQTTSIERQLAGKAVARTAAGVLFLIPGFFSDAIGFLLLLPPVRQWLRSRIRFLDRSAGGQPDHRYTRVIDGEAIELPGDTPGPASSADPRSKPDEDR